MKYLLTIVLLLSGCSTVVPVTAKFPDPPGKGALVRCPNLQQLQNDAKLSDIARTITVNYSTYYECAIRADAWQEWYQVQKHIFEQVSK